MSRSFATWLADGSWRAAACRGSRVESFRTTRLQDYSFGRVVVDGEEQTLDLIVLPERVVTNWRRREGHSLALEDFAEVEYELPEKLILGTGAHGRLRPPRAVIEELERRGIDTEVLSTDDAVPATRSSTRGALRRPCI